MSLSCSSPLNAARTRLALVEWRVRLQQIAWSMMNRHRSTDNRADIIGDRWHGAAASVVFRVDVPAEPVLNLEEVDRLVPACKVETPQAGPGDAVRDRHLCPRIFGNPFEGQIIGAVVDRPAGVGPAIDDDVVLAGVQISHFERLVGARDASGGDVSFDDGILQEVDVDIDANRITICPRKVPGCSVVKR